MKQTTEHPLLGSRFLISKNRQALLGNGSVNIFPQQRNGVVCGKCQGVIRKTTGATKSILYGNLKKRVTGS
jgi:hypothetical protein